MKEFCSFFTNLYKENKIEREKVITNTLEIKPISENLRTLLNQPISRAEVWEAISQAKIGKAPGNDGLSVSIYKLFIEELTTPLQSVMNEALNSDIPESWRQAEIVVIPKEGKNTDDPNNYRPISLLNNDYKFFANILSKRLKKCLLELIGEEQRGFFAR